MSLDRTPDKTAGARHLGSGANIRLRTAAPFAWAITAIAVASGVSFLVLLALNSRDPDVVTYEYWGAQAVMAIVFPAVGALIVSRQPRNALGWLFCLLGLNSGLAGLALQYAVYAFEVSPQPLPGAATAAWFDLWAGIFGLGSLVLVPLLFPDGRTPSMRWRPVVWIAVGTIVLGTVSFALVPGPLDTYSSVDNPFGIEGVRGILETLLSVGWLVIVATFFAGIASLAVRYRRSRSTERQQLKWFVYAVAILPVAWAGNDLFPSLSWLIGGIGLACIPVAIGIAVLKHRLYDIDVVINRTLVYGALTACVVGVYVFVVGYLGALFRVESNLAISLVAAGVVAVLFAPLRDRLQRGVNRMMYGERDDPYAVISYLGERLERTLAPEAVLPTIVQTVREALRLPYAAIALGVGGEIVAESGTPVDVPERVPLPYRGEEIGALLLAPRPGDEGFSPADKRLLEDLARQAGVAVHAVRLTSDLQRSRERLVTAREEERRRLRRDLHDGLGPALGSLPLKLDVAGDLVEEDPDAARALLRSLKEQAQSAVTDIRRLVYALRPPALDDLGLLGALRETVAQHDRNGARVHFETPEGEGLPPLPAAVEVAAYRIAQEALTNAARHAGAKKCTVNLSLDEAAGALRLEVTDDGRGLSPGSRPGVGLHSMRERAEELGGSCVVETLPEGGTRVYASFPTTSLAFEENSSTSKPVT